MRIYPLIFFVLLLLLFLCLLPLFATLLPPFSFRRLPLPLLLLFSSSCSDTNSTHIDANNNIDNKSVSRAYTSYKLHSSTVPILLVLEWPRESDALQI